MRNFRIFVTLVIATFSLTSVVAQQQTVMSVSTIVPTQDKVLKNEDIVKLVEAGLSSGLIVTMVSSSSSEFTTDVDSILALKKKNIPEDIIQAMLQKTSSLPELKVGIMKAPATPANASLVVVSAGTLPTEIGVYAKKKGNWIELLPEVVNWKTGGILKNLATFGIIKGDVNGKINGKHSRNYVNTPLELIVYAPEGVAITEYQFIRLREKKSRREFRTVTGGIFHESGGVTRDLMPFEGRKVARRTYSVIFPTLTPGEYGFLPPTANQTTASLGKMYTFRLVE